MKYTKPSFPYILFLGILFIAALIRTPEKTENIELNTSFSFAEQQEDMIEPIALLDKK